VICGACNILTSVANNIYDAPHGNCERPEVIESLGPFQFLPLILLAGVF
jgi:hypothetical protein